VFLRDEKIVKSWNSMACKGINIMFLNHFKLCTKSICLILNIMLNYYIFELYVKNFK